MKPYYKNELVTLYNGDCLEVLKEIDLTDVIFVSDPPFNVGYHYNEYTDKKDDEVYHEWLADIFGDNKQVLIHYPESLYKHSFQIGEFPTKVISWVYNSNNQRQHRDIAFFNVVPDFTKVGQPYKNPEDKRIAQRIAQGKQAKLYDWWYVNQVKNVSLEKTEHPCQMPLQVMENIIGILPEGYTIIDPFNGSGTTAIACERLGRKYIGIELDKSYCDITVNRLNSLQLKFDI